LPYTQFVDIMGVNAAAHIPPSPGMIVIALYATGSEGIEATAQQIAAYKKAGTGVILIDQSGSLSVFAAGFADVADVEKGAGTQGAAAAAVALRQAHGWQSTIYLSQSVLPGMIGVLEAHGGINMSKVFFAVANYNDSLAAAEAALAANPQWAYIQYGDNITNAGTPVPGARPPITCGQAGCDIDVGNNWFIEQFVPKPPPPPPGMTSVPFRGVYLWTSNATMSMEAFAAARGARALGILTVSGTHLEAPDYNALNDYLVKSGVNAVMPKNLKFCTANP
jgi:hypothetical protein